MINTEYLQRSDASNEFYGIDNFSFVRGNNWKLLDYIEKRAAIRVWPSFTESGVTAFKSDTVQLRQLLISEMSGYVGIQESIDIIVDYFKNNSEKEILLESVSIEHRKVSAVNNLELCEIKIKPDSEISESTTISINGYWDNMIISQSSFSINSAEELTLTNFRTMSV